MCFQGDKVPMESIAEGPSCCEAGVCSEAEDVGESLLQPSYPWQGVDAAQHSPFQ